MKALGLEAIPLNQLMIKSDKQVIVDVDLLKVSDDGKDESQLLKLGEKVTVPGDQFPEFFAWEHPFDKPIDITPGLYRYRITAYKNCTTAATCTESWNLVQNAVDFYVLGTNDTIPTDEKTERPELLSPKSDLTNVPITTDSFFVAFKRPQGGGLSKEAKYESALQILDPNNNNIAENNQLKLFPDSKKPEEVHLTIPMKALKYSTTYTVSFPKEMITLNDVPMDQNFSVKFTTEAEPVATEDPCTEGQTTDNYTKLCIAGEWTLCTENGQFDGQKSPDKKLTCAGGQWIDLSAQQPEQKNEPDEKANCVENNIMMGGLRICKNSKWVVCGPTTDGDLSSDGLKICAEGLWRTMSDSLTQPPPPPSGNIKITDTSAFPVGFNPQITETKISYGISAKAEVDVRILTTSGVTITTLVDGRVLDGGEYFVFWDGTTNSGAGKLVDPGTYQYKITAKDPTNGTIKDTRNGNLNVIYAKTADFENSNTASTQPKVNTAAQQAQATVVMSGTISGSTAATGPGVLAYFLFPASYLIARRKRRK